MVLEFEHCARFADNNSPRRYKDTKNIKEGGLSRPPTTRNAFMTTSVIFFVNFASFMVKK
jgi:hypothetical protein